MQKYDSPQVAGSLAEKAGDRDGALNSSSNHDF